MKPITRLEKFLAKIAKDPNATEIAPKTRKEFFLNEIAENSSSGGSDLPEVTSADNGKVLSVVNGEWDKADAPSGGGAGLVLYAESDDLYTEITKKDGSSVTSDDLANSTILQIRVSVAGGYERVYTPALCEGNNTEWVFISYDVLPTLEDFSSDPLSLKAIEVKRSSAFSPLEITAVSERVFN